MKTLGFSHLLDEKNDDNLYLLNKSMEVLMKTNDTLKNFSKIEFEVEGLYLDKTLKLLVNYTTKKGKKGTELFSSHVDEGAISINSDFIKAYFGELQFHELNLEEGESLDAEYLKLNEDDLFNQLAVDYLILCSPNTENGSEFTKEDELFFKELLIQEPYDAKLELNEYIEKFSEIKPHLDEIVERINNERVLVINDGCSESIHRRVIKYLEDHGIVVQFSDKKE